jgi:hypothetical protein
MMFLTSPQDAGDLSLDHHLHGHSQHTQAIHGHAVSGGHRKVPCQQAKLMPPMELMTRPQALRFAYHAQHGMPLSIRKMSSLEKKEDPEEKARMEAILKHVHEVEVREQMAHEERIENGEEEVSGHVRPSTCAAEQGG